MKKKKMLALVTVILLCISFLPSTMKAKSQYTLTISNAETSQNYSINTKESTILDAAIEGAGVVNIGFSYQEIGEDVACLVYTDSSMKVVTNQFLLDKNETGQKISVPFISKSSLYIKIMPIESDKETYDVKVTTSFQKRTQVEATTAKESTTEAPKDTVTTEIPQTTTETNIEVPKPVGIEGMPNYKGALWNNKTADECVIMANERIYYKITVKNNYFFRLTSNKKNATVALYSSTGKKLSIDIGLTSKNSYKSTFAVGKGTYFIGIGSGITQGVAVTYQQQRIKDYSGKTFKKALKIKTGKEYVGLIKHTDSKKKKDFYRFETTTWGKLDLTIYGELTNGKLEFHIYDSKRKALASRHYKIINGEKLSIHSAASIRPGVYYISVNKTKGSASGTYSIKVN